MSLALAACSNTAAPVSTPPPGPEATAPPVAVPPPAPAAVEAPDVHAGGACGGVDVIELPAADRPRLSLAAKPKVDAIVLAPARLASLPPDEVEPIAAVADVMPYASLPATARSELDAAATATLFPALRAYQAAHDQRVVGSYVVIDAFVLVLDASGAIHAMLAGADPTTYAGCARELAVGLGVAAKLRRRQAEARKRIEDRRPPAAGPCTDNPLAPGC